MTRRSFCKNTFHASVANALVYDSFTEMLMKKKKKVGIQLYTVRDDMKRDAIGTLRSLADMGYKDVESAGYHAGKYYGMSPTAFKKVLADVGLKMRSGHTITGAKNKRQKGTMLNDWERVVADAASIGQEYLVLGYLDYTERRSIEDYERLAELLNKSGMLCNQYGIKLGYHNHDFEFKELEGQVPYDFLLEHVNPDLMTMELDMYWIIKGGKNPFDYFEKYPSRFQLWHVKDMDNTVEQFFTEVGNGIIDYEKIFGAEEQAGMEYFYIEQDVCKYHRPLESAEISIDYLKKMSY